MSNTYFMRMGAISSSTTSGGADQITITWQPVSVVETTDRGATFQGTGYHTMYGGGIPFAQDSYFWVSVDGIGVDPGSDSVFTGMTGYEIALAGAGPFTASALATAAASAAAASGYTLVPSSDTLTVSGNGLDQAATISVANSRTPFASRGGGGFLGASELDQGNNTNAGSTGFNQIDPAYVPSGPFRVIGFELARGTVVTAGVMMCVASGGVNGNPEGASVDHERLMGNSGPSTVHREFFDSDDIVYYSGGETLWIGTHGSGSTGRIIGSASVDEGYLLTGGFSLFITDGVSGTSSFTNPVAAVTNSINYGVNARLIIQEAPYVNNGEYRVIAGAVEGRHDQNLFPGGTDVNSIFVGWGLQMPNITGLALHDTRIHLGTHAAGDSNQLRLELWDTAGGTTSFVGDNLQTLIGVTTDDQGTGWSSVQSVGPISLTAGGTYRYTLKGSPSPGEESDTTFSFDLGGFGVNDAGYPVYSLQGGALEVEELEVISSTTTGDDTSLNFDPQVATTTPNNANGTITFPGNIGMISLVIGTTAPAVVATGS